MPDLRDVQALAVAARFMRSGVKRRRRQNPSIATG